MTTIEKTSRQIPTHSDPRPETSGLTVLGWLLICFAVAPLAMAAAHYGADYLWAGGAMLLIGVLLVLAGRLRRHGAPNPDA